MLLLNITQYPLKYLIYSMYGLNTLTITKLRIWHDTTTRAVNRARQNNIEGATALKNAYIVWFP